MGFSNLLSLLTVTSLWISAGAAWLLAPTGWPCFAAAIFYFLVLWIHRRALSEWMHEAAHFNFHPHRVWNDRILNLLAGPFFFEEMSLHRLKHFYHHHDHGFFHESDPDTGLLLIRTRRGLLWGIVADLSGWTGIRALKTPLPIKVPAHIRRKDLCLKGLAGVAYSLALVVLVTEFQARGVALLVLNFLILIAFYPLFNRVRVYSQHIQLNPDGSGVLQGSRTSRTVWASGVDRIFMHSKVMMYHWEHHHYPSLHFRQLEQICTRDETDPNRFSRGYWRTWLRLCRSLPRN